MTPGERSILAAARMCEQLPDDGSRHRLVREGLGLPYTTYLQRLNALLNDDRALAEDPELVYRLRRRQEQAAERRGHVVEA